MFCASCGVRLADDSVFCHDCGTPITPTPRGAQQPAQATGTSPETLGPSVAASAATARPLDGFRVAIAVGTLAGAVLIVIGTFLPWANATFFGVEVNRNGFDGGYVTDWGDTDGKDGVLTLVMATGAAGLSVLYLNKRSGWVSLGIFGLGWGAAAVGGHNLKLLIDDIRDNLGVSQGDALDYVGEGLYVVIVGGIVTAVVALVGLVGALYHDGRS